MGCGASTRKQKAGVAEVQAIADPQLASQTSSNSGLSSISEVAAAAAPHNTENGDTPFQDEDLCRALAKLSLNHARPGLQKLGVRCLPDILALLVSDLEEASLTRVQARQLQSLAKRAVHVDDNGSASSKGASAESSTAGTAGRTSAVDAACLEVPNGTAAAGIPPNVHTVTSAVVTESRSKAPEMPEPVCGRHAQAQQGAVEHTIAEKAEAAKSMSIECLPEPRRTAQAGVGASVPESVAEASENSKGVTHVTQVGSEISWNLTPRDHEDDTSALESTLWPAAGVEARFVQEAKDERPLAERTLLPDERSPALVACGRSLMGLDGRGVAASHSDEHLRAEAFAAAHLNQCFSPEKRPPRLPCQQSEDQKLSASPKLSGVNLSDPDSDLHIPEALRRRLDQRGRERQTSRERNVSRPQRAPGADVHEPDAEPTPPARSSSCDSVPAGSQTSPQKAGVSRARSLTVQRSGAQGGEVEQGGRQMFDKNTLRFQHRKLFVAALERYRKRMALDRNGAESVDTDAPDLALCTLRLTPGAIHVFLRKRPLFPKEAANGEYDITSLPPGSPLATQVVLHNCLFQADLKTPFMQHMWFDFDHVFGEDVGNFEVYRVAASALISSSRDGGLSTLFMFGQTGSGKTHTMSAIEEYASRDLFQGADALGSNGQEPWLSLEFVELRGGRCFDLLNSGPRDTLPEVRLRERASGSFAVEGATWLYPKSPEELCSAMRAAHARRTTEATCANAESSRSHAVCTLRLRQSGGQLMLVDCAGTERRKDSMHHSRERQQEGADINASLHALKECIRHFATRRSVPAHAYRASNLTKILADAFLCAGEARLAAICTASPCVSDTEHTLTTLRTGMVLGGRGPEHSEKEPLVELLREQRGPRQLHPKQWSPEQVRTWLAEVDRGQFANVLTALPSDFTGQMLVRVTEARCTQLCGGSQRRGQQLYALLHKQMRDATESASASM